MALFSAVLHPRHLSRLVHRALPGGERQRPRDALRGGRMLRHACQLRQAGRQDAVRDVQDLVVVEVVAEPVREHQDQIANTEVEEIRLAVRGGIDEADAEPLPLGEGRRKPHQLVGRVEAGVLLILGAGDDGHPVGALAQHHEARVAEVRHAERAALDHGHDHGGRAEGLRALLGGPDRRDGAQLRAALASAPVQLDDHAILRRATAWTQRLRRDAEQLLRVRGGVDAVAGVLLHPPHSVGHPEGVAGVEARVLAHRAAHLHEPPGPRPELDVRGLAVEGVGGRQRMSVQVEPQVPVEQALPDFLAEDNRFRAIAVLRHGLGRDRRRHLLQDLLLEADPSRARVAEGLLLPLRLLQRAVRGRRSHLLAGAPGCHVPPQRVAVEHHVPRADLRVPGGQKPHVADEEVELVHAWREAQLRQGQQPPLLDGVVSQLVPRLDALDDHRDVGALDAGAVEGVGRVGHIQHHLVRLHFGHDARGPPVPRELLPLAPRRSWLRADLGGHHAEVRHGAVRPGHRRRVRPLASKTRLHDVRVLRLGRHPPGHPGLVRLCGPVALCGDARLRRRRGPAVVGAQGPPFAACGLAGGRQHAPVVPGLPVGSRAVGGRDRQLPADRWSVDRNQRAARPPGEPRVVRAQHQALNGVPLAERRDGAHHDHTVAESGVTTLCLEDDLVAGAHLWGGLPEPRRGEPPGVII
mmetsp:Transcript_6369/g.13540  ORF Transcript_6369/g.13540 Transcript_6369/m.13540 type:complete len:694 (-) Transcript_6369:446-2527(-)